MYVHKSDAHVSVNYEQCLIHGVVHFKRDHKYVMHSSRSPLLLVSQWQLLSNSHHSEMHQDARFSGSSDTCSADPARFGVLIRLLQHQEENPGHQFALLSCLHVEGIPGLSFALDVMPSAMLQQHVCYYVVLAAVSALFHANELCHVDEILDPGLLLGRIGGVRTFRRVHFSSQIPYQISSEST